MTRTTMLVLTALIAIALLPSSALAATCADCTTQAEAQRAGDTRDADGDGVLCVIAPMSVPWCWQQLAAAAGPATVHGAPVVSFNMNEQRAGGPHASTS